LVGKRVEWMISLFRSILLAVCFFPFRDPGLERSDRSLFFLPVLLSLSCHSTLPSCFLSPQQERSFLALQLALRRCLRSSVKFESFK
jgi:hypothetical protein